MGLADNIRAEAQALLVHIRALREQSPPATVEETQDVALALYGLEDFARTCRLLLDPEGKGLEGRFFQSLTGSVTIDGKVPPDPAS